MTLHLYNSLSRTKQAFVPIDPNNIRLYVCGPTVHDYAHIGNARPVIIFDILYRLLRQLYSPERVTYVRNITDIDDKINARAAQEDITIDALTERVTHQYHNDISALGVLAPTVEPRATHHIAEMIDLIEQLIRKEHAYCADAHVLFHVPSMKNYGNLSGRTRDDMIAGARVEVAPYKKDPMDFVLWKPSTPSQPGWPSPWGRGRPGWHIECSAMSWKYLGQHFDIHGGGIDLIFPHHENEIAQSCCAFGTQSMANIWMHNGFLQINSQKMSKSLGNFTTIHALLADWPGEVLRFMMLRSHYRQPIDWTLQGLKESWKVLQNLYEGAEEKPPSSHANFSGALLEALLDDLNSPKAIAALHELDRQKKSVELGQGLAALGFCGNLASKKTMTQSDKAKIEHLIAQRILARDRKDWATSDQLRAELEALHVIVKDNKDGTSDWEMRR